MTETRLFSGDLYTTNLTSIQRTLLAWFALAGRDLPWRHTRDPYRIMVSEIMLQQTQVDRVLPKYQAFLEQFPTLEALANAATADVIRAWAGLGYNRRAVNMQRAARAVIEEFAGQFPHELATLLKLPGIGPYTAGAIACFAFEQDVAFMDTNIRRVIQRLFVGPEEQSSTSDTRLLQIAQAAIPTSQGWAWNQAVMELGALICTANAPVCWRCPLQTDCQAYALRRSADEPLFSATTTAPSQPQRRIAERRETPFSGSNRFYRGRIVDVLRQLPTEHTLSLRELGIQIKDDFSEADLSWLETLLTGLARDGLVAVHNDTARLA